VSPQSPFNLKRLLLVLAISLIAFVLIDQYGWLDQGLIPQGSNPDRVEQIQFLLRVIFLPLIPIGAYVVFLGYQIVRSGRFPPPGSWLLKSLPMQSGSMARLRGWLALFTGICLGGLGIYGAVVVPREIAKLLNIQ
jgi:hypothetical protein